MQIVHEEKKKTFESWYILTALCIPKAVNWKET